MHQSAAQCATGERHQKCASDKHTEYNAVGQAAGESIQNFWGLYGGGGRTEIRQAALWRSRIAPGGAPGKRTWQRRWSVFRGCGSVVLIDPIADFFASSGGQIGEAQAADFVGSVS